MESELEHLRSLLSVQNRSNRPTTQTPEQTSTRIAPPINRSTLLSTMSEESRSAVLADDTEDQISVDDPNSMPVRGRFDSLYSNSGMAANANSSLTFGRQPEPQAERVEPGTGSLRTAAKSILPESQPKTSRGYEWNEWQRVSTARADGTASLSIEPDGQGYLGKSRLRLIGQYHQFNTETLDCDQVSPQGLLCCGSYRSVPVVGIFRCLIWPTITFKIRVFQGFPRRRRPTYQITMTITPLSTITFLSIKPSTLSYMKRRSELNGTTLCRNRHCESEYRVRVVEFSTSPEMAHVVLRQLEIIGQCGPRHRSILSSTQYHSRCRSFHGKRDREPWSGDARVWKSDPGARVHALEQSFPETKQAKRWVCIPRNCRQNGYRTGTA